MVKLESDFKNVLSWFKIPKLNESFKIKEFNSIKEYRDHIVMFLGEENYQEWMIADTFDGNINILRLDLCKKLDEHKEIDEAEYQKVLLHEFVHICHRQVIKDNINDAWFYEALATNLSGQSFSGNVYGTFDQLKNNFFKVENNYVTAYYMGNYLFDNYSHDFVLGLINNETELNRIGPVIFNLVKNDHQRKLC